MSSAGTAAALQHLLEAEGAVIHAALQARALPSMGGGVGMILTRSLPPGSTLARFPFRSMITARKARFNLAMAEVALELHRAQRHPPSPSAADAGEDDLFPVLPFTSRVWSEAEYESRVRSQRIRRAIDAKVEELEEALDSTETIVCYILLMATLHGRWQETKTSSPVVGRAGSNNEVASGADGNDTAPALLRFTHENRWMRTWLHALPVQYDNLLELAPRQSERSAALDSGAAGCPAEATPPFSCSPSSPVPPLPLATSYTTSSDWLRSFVSLARFRAAALSGQCSIARRYQKCHAVLQSLRSMPVGEEVSRGDSAGQSTTLSSENWRSGQLGGGPLQRRDESGSPPTPANAESLQVSPTSQGEQAARASSTECTLGHFLWAFNTLMSRGFYYPEETWAVMPFVDYFNYALESNGTMYPQEDDPEDAECLSNISLSMANPALASAAAPRKQARRTGLRSARVGQGTIPRANYNTYEFQLVRPVRAAGEQVMLHYGAYSDVELLMWYGFTLRPSLLSTSHLSFTDAEASTAHLCGCIPPLPPGLARTGSEHLLLHTACALRVLLPQMACATTRLAHYRRHVLLSSAPAVLNDPGEDLRAATATDAGDNEEAEAEDYSTWAKALQRAYRLPLSPLADAEGNYPAVVPGQTWIDVLFAAFTQTLPLAASSADAAAAVQLDTWMRRWVAQRWPRFADSAFPGIAKKCDFGVFGLSPALQAAITSSFWVASPREWMDEAEQIWLVRGLAWAELYVNLTAQPPADELPSRSCGAPVSAAAAVFAQIASVDQWALLRFLALESSDAALAEYVAYECETD